MNALGQRTAVTATGSTFSGITAPTDNDGVQDGGEGITATFAHDDDGNMTNDGGSGAAGRTFVWDAEWSGLAARDMDHRRACGPQGEGAGGRAPNQYDLTARNPSAAPIKRHDWRLDWRLDLSGCLKWGWTKSSDGSVTPLPLEITCGPPDGAPEADELFKTHSKEVD